MAANDSGVDTSNDSNDNILMFPPGFNINNMRFLSSHPNFVHPPNNDRLQPNHSSPTPSGSCTNKKRFHSPKVPIRKSPYHNRSPFNERKLRLAASLSNVEMLIRLLESGVNPNSSDDYQRSALHLAASRGYTDVVTQLLKYGAKPNLQDSLGNTPLHLAVCSASSSNFNMVVRILVKNGASVQALDRMGKTPLDLARSKLTLMITRRTHEPSPESKKMLSDMSLLISSLLMTFFKEQEQLDEINSLEKRLSSLSTKEVEDEADKLLAKVNALTLKN